MLDEADFHLHDDGVTMQIGSQQYLIQTNEEDLVECPSCKDFMILNLNTHCYECPVCGYMFEED